MSTDELKALVCHWLEAGMATWPDGEKLVVEMPRIVEKYNLSDATGAVLISTDTEKFSGNMKSGAVKQNRDTFLLLTTVVRSSAKQSSEWYHEEILKMISGKELVTEKRDDNFILPVSISFLQEKEDNTVWFGMLFKVPRTFIIN